MTADNVQVVAWCSPSDPDSHSAFSWPGTDHRKKLHPVALVLATDYESAIARAEAAERHAQRYRWLRDGFFWEDERDFGPGGGWFTRVRVRSGHLTLDAAIDAESPPQQAGG